MPKLTDRLDRITLAEGRKLSAPPAPISCKIELTGRCNFQCSFCATSLGLRPVGDMSFDFYSKTLLPQLRAAGVTEVGMFFLGESMLLPALPQFIAEAKLQGFEYVFLTTNGSQATPVRVRDCMAAGLDSLKFSLNYADAEQFAQIARVKPALFHKMIENIRYAAAIKREHNFKTGLFASYIAYDGEQGEKMRALVDQLRPDLDEVYALPLYSQADLVGQVNADAGRQVKAGNPGRIGALRPAVPCWSLFSEARVTWDGHLAACCFDHDKRFEMGDLTTTPFMEAWHSPKFQELRQAHLAEDVSKTACAGCVAWG